MSNNYNIKVRVTVDPKVSAVIGSFQSYMDNRSLANNAAVKAAASALLTSFNNSTVTIKPVTEDDTIVFYGGSTPYFERTALLQLINGPTADNLARFNSVMDSWYKQWNLM